MGQVPTGQPRAPANDGDETVWKIIRDVHTDLGWSADAITLIYAVVSLSGAAVAGAVFKLLDGGGPLGADDALSLFEIFLITAPLTLALAIVFVYTLQGGLKNHLGVTALVIAGVLWGMAFLFGVVEYDAPQLRTESTQLGTTEPLYSDQGISLKRAIVEANKVAHPFLKLVAIAFLLLGYYVFSFGLAAFLASFVLAYQLARFYSVYWPRLKKLG
jgi:hypothetical protein